MFGDRERATLVTMTATFVGLLAIGGFLAVPFFPVPITLQTLFVLLTGVVMGRYAVIPPFLYLVFGIMGLPVFHNGTAGIGIVLGPTGGYLVGFIPAAAIVGIIYEKGKLWLRIPGIVLGTITIYGFGVSWLMLSANLDLVKSLLVGVIPFIPGDILKGIAAYLIADKIHPENKNSTV